MKLKTLIVLLGTSLIAFTTSVFTYAEESTGESGWYIGGNVGQSRAHVDAQKMATDVMATGYSSTYLDHNTIDSGYKVYGGYQFNRYISVESGYFDLGDAQFNHITTPAGVLTNDMRVRGINIDVVGYLPFTEKLSAFARLGANYALTQDTFTGTGAANVLGGKRSERDTYGKAGVGLQYQVNDAWALRIESERYRIGNAFTDHNETDLFSVGMTYKFGTHKKATPVVAAPVVAPPPPPAPRVEKVKLSSTTLFTFDKSDINTPPAELEQYSAVLKSNSEPKQVNITGYTDRLGSDEYNQKLSERRALAVKNYLVDKGVAADRLMTEGKGEKDPVVECTDKDRTALINCLQPNRRVKIDEINITREVKPGE